MEELKDLLSQTPENFGIARARWTLGSLREMCPDLAVTTDSGVYRILERLKFSYKQGRRYVHSPDPDYSAKKQAVDRVVASAREHPGKIVTLYADEMGYGRYPTPAPCWHETGKSQPLCREVADGNYKSRILACLDATTGRVLRRRAPKTGVIELTRFMKQIRAAYPRARRIYLVWDNWPIHNHQAVLAAAAEHRITPVLLPTYAPWLNPIEKLWKKLRQEVLHMHRMAGDWKGLRVRVSQFFVQFAAGSPDLLRYVGLLPI